MSLLRLLLAGALVLAAILAVTGWFVFVPRAPAPSGPHAVARLELALRDPAGGAAAAPVAVTVWHPRDLRTAQPLILYSPGWGAPRTQSSLQAANLASHGFVVVACDDIAANPATDPDRGVSFELTSDAATAASIERAGRHAAAQAGRLLAVLRALEAGQGAGQAAALAGRLDLARVGVLGYSIGGASGLAAALADRRIAAVVNVDGGLFGPSATEIGVANYFLISSREAFPTDAELKSPDAFTRNYAMISALDIPRNRRRMERPGGYWVQLPAAEHADLSDALFQPSHATLFRPNTQRRALLSAVEAFEVAFFMSTLKGETGPFAALLGRSDQTVRWISPISPPPGAASARQ